MGLFDWLRAKPKRVAETDRIWLTRTAKLAGLAAQAAGGPVLILAHFPDTLREVEATLRGIGFAGDRIDGPLTVAECRRRLAAGGPRRPAFALVSQLPPSEPVAQPGGDRFQIFVAERHFLRNQDDRVVQFADAFGVGTRVSFFSSLDEPLMKRFTGEWMGDVLRRLGMEEKDAIESPMVQRRVKAAQAKFAAAARGDEPADSADQWLERNCP